MKQDCLAQVSHIGAGAFLQVSGIIFGLAAGILLGIDNPAAWPFLAGGGGAVAVSYVMGFFRPWEK